MDLTKVFHRDAVVLDFLSKDGDHAVLELLKVLEDQEHLASEHRDEVLLALLKRETFGGTGVGTGVALPHVKTDYVDAIRGVVGISPEGLEFDSPDGAKVKLVFLFLSPTWAVQEHLKLMAILARLIRNEDFVSRIMSATSESKVHHLLLNAETYLE